MEYDIIILGDYFFDQIFWGLPGYPSLGCETFSQGLVTTGGAMYITAVAMTRLGVQVGWPATFGNDQYSALVHELSVREGIDLGLARMLERSYARVTSAIPYAGERAFVTYCDPDADDLIDFWVAQMQASSFKHVHLGGLMGRADFERIAAVAKAKGATISSDCQDGTHLEKPCQCREMLPQLDLFMPNAREARIIAETDDIHVALDVLMQHVPHVVVKDGGHGVWVGKAGQVQHVNPIQAGAVLDTTGAGDCFNAGFLYGYIVEQAPLPRCGLYGNICGGLSVTGVGGATNAPNHAELMRWAAAG